MARCSVAREPQLGLQAAFHPSKVDVKKAIYVFLPMAQPVALMLDSKPEKANGDRTATIQMSQTSMNVRMERSGNIIDEPGRLEKTIVRGHRALHVVTVVAKYVYKDVGQAQELRRIIVCVYPQRYPPRPLQPERHRWDLAGWPKCPHAGRGLPCPPQLQAPTLQGSVASPRDYVTGRGWRRVILRGSVCQNWLAGLLGGRCSS